MAFRKPLVPPPVEELVRGLGPGRLAAAIAAVDQHGTPYLHWDEVVHKPRPGDLTAEEWWVGLKLTRAKRHVPLVDREGSPFWYAMPDAVLESLHLLDQLIGGQITLSEQVTSEGSKDRYVVSSLIEEAITSSQMEGASTTRKVAKEMLRSGRAPVDLSERMILNNYRAMQRIRELRDQPITPQLVLDLHRLVTEGTLDDPAAAGRLQQPGDVRVRVWDESGPLTVLHTPPDAEELPARLEAMCAFANERPGGAFVHPVVRAIVLHFWLAYDHPFEDGNGRTARALFYWSMLTQGYWLVEFLSISSILKKAKVAYDRSFLYTETDDNDLTYFVDRQLGVIAQAVEELTTYLQRKQGEVREVEAALRADGSLNHRQSALIGKALRDSGAEFTVASHRRSHGVSYETARSDLLELAERGLVRKSKRGKSFVFAVPFDLPRRLEEL